MPKSAPPLTTIRDLIQVDVNRRGLRAHPSDNPITAAADDFAAACRHMGETRNLTVAIVTGFMIPDVDPPRPETDGPLGAVFLARCLAGLGAKCVIASDPSCEPALVAGLRASGCQDNVELARLPDTPVGDSGSKAYWEDFDSHMATPTHLVAIERVGPSHTLDSVRSQAGASDSVTRLFETEVPDSGRDRCYTMKGRDITGFTRPAHLLFQAARQRGITTIGIGDGGNEIGMGKIPWMTIRANIPLGHEIACRVATDFLIVAGVSNWGAYGLAAGIRRMRGAAPDPHLFDPDLEKSVLQSMVEEGGLIDGVSGKPTMSVDGLDFDRYAEPLVRLRDMNV